MKKTKNYSEEGVLLFLSRKKDIKVEGKHIHHTICGETTDVGNGTMGRISYLIKYHGYSLTTTKI